ncbi:MAG TPA: DUF1707 domain-containing protein [Longimicrobiales bacterium]|nr:DUF1707 domain-containing protein [Longimicrobiales bacterium]
MDRPVPQLSLKEQRERTVLALCDHFAADRLELADFEARLDGAHRARSGAELQALLADLPAPREVATPPKSAASEALARGTRATVEAVRETRTLVAFMGGVERRGHWTPARRNLVVAVMGGAELDFREVDLPAGETEVVLFCFMGGAEIIVPPGLSVDANGIAIMGGFEHASPPRSSEPDAPVLKLTGVAVMGGVEIVVRHPGETAKDARQRERDERRNRQRRLRGEPGNDR